MWSAPLVFSSVGGIFKSGIRVQGIEAVEKVWLTCCALHNWLLEIDGNHKHFQFQVSGTQVG